MKDMNKNELLNKAHKFNLNLVGFLPWTEYYSKIYFNENKGHISLQTPEESIETEFEISPESLERSVEEVLIKIGKAGVREEVINNIWEQIEKSEIIFKGEAKEIIEEWCGTRNSKYYYVVEDKILKHISNYSVYTTPTKELVGRKIKIKRYIVPTHVFDKTIFEFSFSKSVLSIKNIRTNEPIKKEEISINYNFEIKSEILKNMINDFKKDFIKMVEEVNNYSTQLNFKISFSGKAERTQEVFKDPQLLFISSMVLPSDKSRIRSLKMVMKWIYQIWVLKLVCEGLGCKNFEGDWTTEQGKPYPVIILNTHKNSFSIWLEPQYKEAGHMERFVTGREEREPVRPNLIICKGKYEDLKEVLGIDLLVECEPSKWKKERIKQLVSYKEKFKPKFFMLVSFYEVPHFLKSELTSRGVVVKDKLNIDASDEINTFKNEIKSLFEESN